MAKLLVEDAEDSPEALQSVRNAIKAVESASEDPMYQQVVWGMTETGAQLLRQAREVCDVWQQRAAAPRPSLHAAHGELQKALQAVAVLQTCACHCHVHSLNVT